MKSQKKQWISIGKCIAILAVLTDHMHGTLYASEETQRVSFFSVTLFILLMGVTTFWSFDNSRLAIGKKVKKRLIGIIVPYIVAVFIYHVVIYKGFYWNEFVNSLIQFNISGPHYYILLYIQLLIVSPVIFYLIEKISKKFEMKAWVFELLFGGGCALLALICNTHTDIAGIYAGRLFGGSYIICLYIGMLFGKYYKNANKIRKKCKYFIAVISSIMVLSFGSFIFTNGFFLDTFPILASVVNPPGVTEIVYTLFILIAVCFWDNLVKDSSTRFLNYLFKFLSYIGGQTLYIFLYHRLFLDYFLNRFLIGVNILYIRIPVFYLVMIFGSIAIGYVYKAFSRLLKSSYLFRRE